jgi:hypothetical protein
MKTRSFNTLAIYLHKYRGFSGELGILVARVTLGFITIAVQDIDVILALNSLHDQLNKLSGEK